MHWGEKFFRDCRKVIEPGIQHTIHVRALKKAPQISVEPLLWVPAQR